MEDDTRSMYSCSREITIFCLFQMNHGIDKSVHEFGILNLTLDDGVTNFSIERAHKLGNKNNTGIWKLKISLRCRPGVLASY